MFRSRLLGLTPWQTVAVMTVFIVTLIGALVLAAAFRSWNQRQGYGVIRAAVVVMAPASEDAKR